MAKTSISKEAALRLEIEPVSNIQWVDARELKANDYNPNYVMSAELELLAVSLVLTGWIQPVLSWVHPQSGTKEIVDGYHRVWLSCNHKKVIAKYNYLVPASFLDVSEPERMMLTVRINRAKGVHQAVKMHELVSRLFNEFGIPKAEIAEKIGATAQEVDLLIQENVFTKLNIPKHKWSPAWAPDY